MSTQYNILKGMANINAQAQSFTEESAESQPGSARESTSKPESSSFKQPRARPDVWEEEALKAKDQTLKLNQNLQQKKQAWSRGEQTTKQDYHLRSGVANQRATLEHLKELVDYYNFLMKHATTDYSKVFVRKPNITKQTLILRCQEYVEINDSAQPIIQMIEDQTMDVKTLIKTAKSTPGHMQAQQNQREGLQGIQYQPHITDEEVLDYQRRSNQELIQIQKKGLEGQDRYLDQIEVIAKSIKYEGQNFGKEVNEQAKLIEKITNQIDHTRMGLSKVDSRLGELIAEMSFCKLWTAIVVECILIVVVIFM